VTANLDFKVLDIDAVDVLCAQLTRDLFAIAKFPVCFCVPSFYFTVSVNFLAMNFCLKQA